MGKDDIRDARELLAALGTGLLDVVTDKFESERATSNYRKLVTKLATIELDYKPKPTIERIERNGPATIAFWSDGTKTVTTRRDEPEDAEKAFAVLIAKKFYKGWYSDFKRMGKGIVDIHGIRLSEGDGFALVDAYGVPDNYLRIAKRIFWSDEKHSWGVEYSHPRHIGNITQYACDTSFEIEITPDHLNPNKQTLLDKNGFEITVGCEIASPRFIGDWSKTVSKIDLEDGAGVIGFAEDWPEMYYCNKTFWEVVKPNHPLDVRKSR